MAQRTDERFEALVEKIREDPGLDRHLPILESRIVRAALAGRDAGEIAQLLGVSEGYVWTLIANAAREADVKAERSESAGLGSDTDPGVTGGYGETGFGSLDEETPMTGTDESYEAEEAEDLLREEHL